MTTDAIVVLGASNTGLSIAAKLALEGRRVVLWEAPSHAAAIEPLLADRRVRLTGTGGEGTVQLAAITTDAAEALGAGDVLIAAVPSYAHRPFADALLPHLRPRHVLALLPGNLGTLALAQLGREAQAAGALLAEADTAPYVCRKLAPDHAHIFGVVPHLGVGALPARETPRALAALEPLFPGLRPYPHVVAAGIGALNPVVHPPGVLMNAGRIERSHGDFYFYEEGVTPAVVRAIEALDRERQAIGAALGFAVTPVAEGFAGAGFGPAGDLWATINGSRMLTAMRAPGAIETRWLSEDVPYGLRTWVELGERFGVALPVARSLVTLADAVLGTDSWSGGRSLADLGLDGLDRAALDRYLREG